MRKRSLVFMALLSGLLLTAAAGHDRPSDDRAQLLDRLRATPELYSALLLNLERFNALPEADQERIRNLERDINAETSATQQRLRRAAGRYAQWFESLTPQERQLIESASSSAERLERIRALRRRQWVQELPPGRLAELRKSRKTDVRASTLLQEYRNQQAKFEEDWRVALRHWDELRTVGPVIRLGQLPEKVKEFVQQRLQPRLSREDWGRLKSAENYWPRYPRTLVEVVDKNTFRLLLPEKGPSQLKDVPAEVRDKLSAFATRRLQRQEGKWPDFALTVADSAEMENLAVPQLGPCKPKDFPAPIGKYIIKELLGKGSPLDREEQARLRSAEGKWPQYPKLLAELIARHDLEVPGVSLPGSSRLWDRYRARPRRPERSVVPDQTLRYFALLELTPEERMVLRVSLTDAAGRERLQHEYIERHPEEWRQIQKSDAQKRERVRLAP